MNIQLKCLECKKTVTIDLKTAGLVETRAVCASCSHKYEIVDGKLQKKKKTEWVEELDLRKEYTY